MSTSHPNQGRTTIRRQRRAATILAAGIAATGISLLAAPTAQAGVITLPAQNGHTAFGLGPHATPGACQTDANRLAHYGARNYGGTFGTCVRVGNAWYAVSPWGQ